MSLTTCAVRFDPTTRSMKTLRMPYFPNLTSSVEDGLSMLSVAAGEFVHPAMYHAVSRELGVGLTGVAPYLLRANFEGVRWVVWLLDNDPRRVPGVQFEFDGVRTTAWKGTAFVVAHALAPSAREQELGFANAKRTVGPDGVSYASPVYGRNVYTPLDTIALLKPLIVAKRFKLRWLSAEEADAAPAHTMEIASVLTPLDFANASGARAHALVMKEKHEVRVCCKTITLALPHTHLSHRPRPSRCTHAHCVLCPAISDADAAIAPPTAVKPASARTGTRTKTLAHGGLLRPPDRPPTART
jgi:hypothetical protein